MMQDAGLCALMELAASTTPQHSMPCCCLSRRSGKPDCIRAASQKADVKQLPWKRKRH